MKRNPALKEIISKRRSTRSYDGTPVSQEHLAAIKAFMADLQPLYPNLTVHAEILDAADVRCMQPWKTPHFVSICTEDSPEALINVGFMFQQLDLYLQSLGLGCCWVGMGKPRKAVPAGLIHAILMPFGVSAEPVWRSSAEQFKRKPLAQLADQADPRLEPVRLAPSAVNSQPWYFLHDGDLLHVYQVVQGPLKRMTLGRMNCIDMGIALCHLALTCEGDFFLQHREDAPALDGHTYIGSVPAK